MIRKLLFLFDSLTESKVIPSSLAGSREEIYISFKSVENRCFTLSIVVLLSYLYS